MKGHANDQAAPAVLKMLAPPPPPPPPPPLKSNLKKPSGVGEVMVKDGRRVTWPDAHGRDLAHVRIFHTSFLEEKEFAVAGKSCICSIL